MKFLIIEEDYYLSKLFKQSLEKYNIDYKIANSGVEAYQILFRSIKRNESFDYVITNIGLPDENGIEIIKFIKFNFKESCIIIYTNKKYDIFKNKISYFKFYNKSDYLPIQIINDIIINK